MAKWANALHLPILPLFFLYAMYTHGVFYWIQLLFGGEYSGQLKPVNFVK